VLLASGVPYHDAGATPALELGACIATAIAYVRAAQAEGVDPASQLVLRLVVDSDVFVSMAKIRAARWLWRAVARRLSLGTQEVRISARTAWRNRTRRAPWVNLLRSTVEAFAGVTGGADDLVVQPLDEVLGPGTDAARRWALDTQHILRAEAHVAVVHDPAAGCGYVETLTRSIAADAWSLVREIEAAGGMADALASGLVQSKIPPATDATLVGVTLYPDPDEDGLPEPEDPPLSLPLPPLPAPVATTTPVTRPRLEETA
jgi:methylmalonyl-CoA mutase